SSFLQSLNSQCPLSFFPHSLALVNRDFLNPALRSKQGHEYTSVLIYASWCPFRTMPILHLKSYVPCILKLQLACLIMINKTSRMRYHGSEDLYSLIKFYRETTDTDKECMLSILCLVPLLEGGCLCVPKSLTCFTYLWVSYQPHLNSEIFGETSQISGHILHVIDLKMIWTKLKTLQEPEITSGCKECSSVGIVIGFCLPH
ncbi:hypothetical protein Pfo_030802, partial [Paulownia fortunei]